MKGITHGACDYLLKPVRLEELQNIWQHVLRKKRTRAKDVEHSTSHEKGERCKFGGGEDVEYTSSATDTINGNYKLMKIRRRKRLTRTLSRKMMTLPRCVASKKATEIQDVDCV